VIPPVPLPPLSTDAELRPLCERVLANNWREGQLADGTQFGYTSPSLRHYPWQWYWDSCFAAIARRRFDPARARQELESLLTAATPDGFIGHTVFWDLPLRGPRRFTYNVTEPQATMTASIQPPLLAWAWSLAVGDPAQEPRLARHLDWFEHHRVLDGDGLIWIVQPDESGLDASPQFDPVWRWRAHDLPGFLTLVRHNRRLRYDLRAVAASGWPVMCEVLTNVLYSLSRTALGRSSLTAALIERCYDERSGLFRPLVRPALDARMPVTWTALAPLALPDLPEQIGRRLVEEHLLNRDEYWTPVAPPSVAANERGYEPGGGHGPVRRYWRGPTWINSAWMVWLGLRRLGYAQEAQQLADGVIATVAREGLREYYDPRYGTGMGAKDFAWSALVAELADPRPDDYL
jgi:hypothetical protein